MRGFGKTPVIGLDLGSGYIKISQIRETGKELNLVNIGLLPTPEGSIENAKIVKPDEIAEAIRTLMRMYSFIGKRVVTAVSGQLVTVRTLVVDNLPKSELDEVIKWEMSKVLPYKIEDASFDYQIIGAAPKTEGKKISVIAAAASLDIINSIVAAIKLAKLEPVAIEIESFAELRLLDYVLKDDYKNTIIVLVNSGHSFTSINIIEDGILRFTRIIPFGGRSLIKGLSNKVGTNEKEAENLLVTMCNVDLENVDKESDTFKVTSSIMPLIEEFVLELKRSLMYYRGLPSYSGKSFEIIMGGGTSKLRGLIKYIKTTLGVETKLNDFLYKAVVYNPKLFTEEYLLDMAPFFSVSVGLSMREAIERFEKTRRLELSRKRTKKKKIVRIVKRGRRK